MKRTTIYLDPELEVLLKLEVLRQKRPMARIVRDAVEAYVTRTPRQAPPGAGAFASGRSDTADRSDAILAETYGIPPELLAKVLQRLVRRRLLTSHQGIRGGYTLARPAAAISVADVIQAVDGPLTVTACSEVDHSCEQYAKCNIRDPLWRIKDRIVAALAATSVAELAAELSAPPPSDDVPLAVLRK